MNERIMAHVEGLFQDAPKTKKITELKEEIISNCNCKYEDLVAGGSTPDEAFKTVISGIGDVSDLISQLETGISPDTHLIEKGRKKSALLVSVAVGLFILSPSCIFVSSWLNLSNELALFLLFACVAAGVALLIYNSMTTVEYTKADETMVEEFREWKVQKSQKKTLRSNLSVVLWPLILISYFIISFKTQAWYITWVVFIAGVMIEGIISIIFDMRKDSK